jgi:hypothetical protein
MPVITASFGQDPPSDPAHPSFALHTEQSTDAGYNEQAVLLDLGDGRLGE